jgi:hypothetical protein
LAENPTKQSPILEEISESCVVITELLKHSINNCMDVSRAQSKYDSIVESYRAMPN